MLLDTTLVDLVRRQAAERGDRTVFTFFDGSVASRQVSYVQLQRRAQAIATTLTKAGAANKRALLLYAPDLEYVFGFLGCLFAGVTAVPAYPPDPSRLERSLPRLRAIAADAECDVVLTTAEIKALAEFMLPQAPELAGIEWIATDAVSDDAAEGWAPPDISRESLAFIQYTSGSTGHPKGVVLAHGNLLHNLELIVRAFQIGPDAVGFSWLPPYHDMGLIGGILSPIACGGHTALMSPIAFLQRPIRWLEGISRFRASVSGGPNFAYELCLRRATPDDLERLDLSSWQLAFSGAEQVRPETLDRFSAMFGPCGFRRETFYPCYGLAEATLIVSGGDRQSAPIITDIDASMLERGRAIPVQDPEQRHQVLVGCGNPLEGHLVRVVDPQTLAVCAEKEVGEIWVSGASVAKSYWRRAEATERTLRASLASEGDARFLRTGDLGYLHGGELFVTGRLKDLIIVRGRNLYPQDIEKTAEEAHPSLRRGCCAAFALEIEGDEEFFVAVELERRYTDRRKPKSEPPKPERRKRQADRRSDRPTAPESMYALGAALAAPSDMDEVCEEVRRAVARVYDVRPHLVLLLRAGGLPKTSSGKIQRSETRKLFLQGQLPTLAQSETQTNSVRRPKLHVEEAPPSSEDLARVPRDARASRLASFLRSLVAAGLGVSAESVPLDAPLTTLGLDSLTSVEIAHTVEQKLGALLPASAFLRERSIADLARDVAGRVGSAPPPPMPTSGVSPVEARLSAGQHALWFLQRLAPDSAAYNVACALQMPASPHWETFLAVTMSVMGRHPILRTKYPAQKDGRPTAVVEQGALPAIVEVDATGCSHGELARRVNHAASEPFDLSRGPMLRVQRYVRSDGASVVLFVTHHIALDFWALTQLLGEIREEFESTLSGAPTSAPRSTVPYCTFTEWQQRSLDDRERLWLYWRDKLGGTLPRINLPTDRPRPRHQSFRGATHRFEVDVDLTRRVRSFARHRGATPFVVLLTAFQLLLHQRANADDVLVGIPAAGRTRARLSRIIGLLMNVVVIRTAVSRKDTFVDLVYQVRDTVLDAIDHQEMPFSENVARLSLERDPARSPLIDVLFAFEQAQSSEDHSAAQLALGIPGATASWAGVAMESFPISPAGAPFDLTLTLAETPTGLAGWVNYCSDLFDRSTVEAFADAYLFLLSAVLSAPTQPIRRVDLVPSSDRALLARLNDTASSHSAGERLHDLVQAQIARTPDATAVRAIDGDLSYRDLGAWAERLAGRLVELGAKPDQPIAVCLPRTTGVAAGHLGVLNSGAAFLPLDPKYPLERLRFMLEDSGAALVVTTRALGAEVFADLDVLCVDIDETRQLPEVRSFRPPSIGGEQLAYVIYTSGSTGVPKGVAVPHRAVVNFLESMRAAPGLAEHDVLAAVTTTSFDISTLELFLPLICGARIELLDERQILDGRRLRQLLTERGVTVMQATPGIWQVLEQVGGAPAGIRVLCGGEAFPRGLADALLRRGSTVRNLYGPTETTIWSTSEAVLPNEASVFLGRPIANTQVHVLDALGGLAPVGCPGEIYIGGEGVARGYLNRPALTAERFVPDPFAKKPGMRMYRTGDLGRWRLDGRLEFFGRADAQVKVRGYRVELGEIDTLLGAHPGVSEATVVARPRADGATELIAFFTADGEQTPDAVELQRHLGLGLPAYMVPARFDMVATMPRTPNGKIDRKALIADSADLPSVEVLAPRNALERTVCGIFEEVLSTTGVGVRHDFFAAGGHSLMATQVIARIADEIGEDVPLRLLFEARTPEKLASALASIRRGPTVPRLKSALLKPIPRAPRRRLSPQASDTSADLGHASNGRRRGDNRD